MFFQQDKRVTRCLSISRLWQDCHLVVISVKMDIWCQILKALCSNVSDLIDTAAITELHFHMQDLHFV